MGITTLARGCPAETQFISGIGIVANAVRNFCLEKRTKNERFTSLRTEKRGSLSMDEEEKVCGTCKWNQFDRMCNEFVCDNPDSEGYGCQTMYWDSCEGWESKE